MNWKYIPKKDKISILLLICLILVFASVNFYLSKSKNITDSENQQITDSLQWYYSPKEVDTYFQDLKSHNINTIKFEALLPICSGDSSIASQIISYRNQIRGFRQMSQLMEIRSINSQMYKNIVEVLTTDSLHDSIYINTETFESLLQHPYLNYNQCLAIEDYRTRKGPILSIKRLELWEEFRTEDIKRLNPYISFSKELPRLSE